MKKLLIAALTLCICVPAPVFAADNMTVKDGNAAAVTVCSKDQGSGVQAPCHFNVPGENHIGEVGGRTAIAGCAASPCFTTTSATTAWSSGQVIADSTTAGSVTVMRFDNLCRVSNGTGMIRRARVKIASDSGFLNSNVILYFYKTAPTLTNGDRGAWLTTESNYLGKVPITLNNHFSDFEKGTGVPVDSQGNVTEINYDCNGTNGPSAIMVANGTITPQAGSKAVTAVIEALVN